jgi:protein-S-isoprenylcysteine O-methyltransferase Ste14
MLWARGLIFTLLVPVGAGVIIPMYIDPAARPNGGLSNAGWCLVAVGGTIYTLCLVRFLAAGGTPAIYFTRALRHVIGEEPGRLISEGLYRYSRNPMYLGVLFVIFGEAIIFASARLAAYGAMVFLIFHAVVVFVEEPHLRAVRGPSYEAYCHAVPRWLPRLHR